MLARKGRASRHALTGVVVALLTAAAGCAGEDEKEVLPPVVLGMLETTAPAFDDGETQIFMVQREVRLPYRQPKDSERPKGQLDPYPRVPFHVAADSRVTVRFTLSNLDDRPHNVDLLVDPWNEFVRYVPGVTVDDEDVIPNFSGIQRTFIVPAKGRIEGILTPDDMVELAMDLTIAMALAQRPPDAMGDFGGAALYNRTFNIQNRSSEPDPVLRSWMPVQPKSAVAGITGFDIGLRTFEASRIAVELVIDIEDLNGERVVMTGDDEEDKQLNRPGDTLTPPAGAAPM